MTKNDKQERIDRLAKAREERFKKNPPAYKHYDASVVAKPDDDEFSLKNVREWIKEAKSLRQAEHRNHVSGVKGALAVSSTVATISSSCLNNLSLHDGFLYNKGLPLPVPLATDLLGFS